MTCKKCGAEVANGNMFCTQCGYQFLPPLPKAVYMYYIAALVLGGLLSIWFSFAFEWLAVLTIPFMAMILFCFIPLFNFKKMVPGIIIVSISCDFIYCAVYKVEFEYFWHDVKHYGFEGFKYCGFSSRAIGFILTLLPVLLFLTVCLLKKFKKYRLITYIIVSVYALLAATYADIFSWRSRSESIIIKSISIAFCLLGLYLGKLIHSWLSQRYDI